jgi:hypothetical protein
MPQQKQMQVQLCCQLFANHSENLDGFFATLVTGDKSWFHYQTHEKKKQSMQWKSLS